MRLRRRISLDGILLAAALSTAKTFVWNWGGGSEVHRTADQVHPGDEFLNVVSGRTVRAHSPEGLPSEAHCMPACNLICGGRVISRVGIAHHMLTCGGRCPPYETK